MFMMPKQEIERLRELTDILDESDAAIYMFFRLCPIVMVVADRFRFHRVSDYFCRVLQRDSAELCSRPWSELIHPEDVDTTRVTARTQDGEDIIGFTNRYLRADGTYVSLRWRAGVWSDGGLTYAVAEVVR